MISMSGRNATDNEMPRRCWSIKIEGGDLRELARFCSTATENGGPLVLTWTRGDEAHYEAHGWIGAEIARRPDESEATR